MVTHSSSAKFKSVPAVLSRSLSSHWLSYSCHYLCVWHASKGIFAVTTSCIKWSPCFSPACTTASCQHNRLAVLVARYHGTSTNNTQTSGSTWKMFSRWQWCYQVYCQMDSTAPPSCTLVVESEENGLLVHGKVPTIFSCWLDESSSGFCNWSYGEVCAINSVETSFLWIHTYFVLQMDSTAPPSCTLVVESEENGLLVHGKVPTIFSCWLDESSSGFCNWSTLWKWQALSSKGCVLLSWFKIARATEQDGWISLGVSKNVARKS